MRIASADSGGQCRASARALFSHFAANASVISSDAFVDPRVYCRHFSAGIPVSISSFFQSGFQLTGIIYIRPGHVNSQDAIKIIDTLFNQNIEIDIPFIIVAELVKNKVKIRVRPLLIGLEQTKILLKLIFRGIFANI